MWWWCDGDGDVNVIWWCYDVDCVDDVDGVNDVDGDDYDGMCLWQDLFLVQDF